MQTEETFIARPYGISAVVETGRLIQHSVTRTEVRSQQRPCAQIWPELECLTVRWVNHPGTVPVGAFPNAGVRIRESYRMPIVGYRFARDRALYAFEKTINVAQAGNG